MVRLESLRERFSLAVVAVLGLCGGIQPAFANAITDVDTTLLAAIRASASTPPVSSRGIAMVSIAMYDAVNATTGLYDKPYAYQGPAATGLSADAAAYAAGYAMLSSLFPGLSAGFQTQEAAALANLGLSPTQLASSVSFGSGIASSFYTARATDGSATAQTPYVPGNQPGNYQFTAPGQTTIVQPGWGNVTPFAITSVASVSPPPLWGPGTAYADETAYLASAHYQSDLTTVQTIGCSTCGQTKDELDLTAFWSDTNGNAKFASTETPPGQWLAITDSVAQAAGLDLVDTARLTALVGTSMADAGIVSWAVKNFNDFWRPDTAIHATIDPSWKPLWPDPQFQSYVSGHSTYSMSAATALATYFGTDDVSFCSTADPNSHDAANQPLALTPYATPVVTTYDDPYGGSYTVTAISPSQRCYSSFSSAAYEAGISRVLGGIHFPTDNVVGLSTGAAVALEVAANQFSVPEPASITFVAAGVVGLFGMRRRARIGCPR